MELSENLDSSDDEIFTGPITLKEVKKAVMLRRRTLSPPVRNTPGESIEENYIIIRTTSEPDIQKALINLSANSVDTSFEPSENDPKDYRGCPAFSISYKDTSNMSTPPSEKKPDLFDTITDDSFVAMENYVTLSTDIEVDIVKKEDVGSDSESDDPLDNTFDRVQYILDHGPQLANIDCQKEPKPISITPLKEKNRVNSPRIQSPIVKKEINKYAPKGKNEFIKTTPFKTPAKPISRLPKCATNLAIKTPPHTYRPIGSPSSVNLQNIVSPIGFYIKNSPAVPRIKKQAPKKVVCPETGDAQPVQPPKLMDDFVLPFKGYKAAKEKVIETTPGSYLPVNNQVTKMVSGVVQPTVLNNERRERYDTIEKKTCNIPKYRNIHSDVKDEVEDSFANLSIASADVSMYVAKSAVKTSTLSK